MAGEVFNKLCADFYKIQGKQCSVCWFLFFHLQVLKTVEVGMSRSSVNLLC